MKLKNIAFLSYIILIFFTFVYTININLNSQKNINSFNMLIVFGLFLIWLFAWYLFFIKDIIKSDQLERNRIGLVLIILAIIVFYYNPLPFPNEYELEITREYFFYYTIFSFINCIIFSYKKPYFITSILIFIPLIINSFFTNIIKNDYFFQKYPYFTISFGTILLLVYFGYNSYSKEKNNKK